RRLVELLLSPLLEERLVVSVLALLRDGEHLVIDVAKDETTGGLEPRVLVDRRDDRFEDVREEGGRQTPPPRHALPHVVELADPEPLAALGEHRRADDDGLDLRERPLVLILEMVVEKLGHDETEDAVPQELEALVRGIVEALDGGVGQCLEKQAP